MKYLMVDAGYTFDDSTKVLKKQNSERQGVNSIYVVKEDCTVVFRDQAEQATAGDIVVTFYEKDFPKQMVVVKSEDWRKNIEAYNDKQQKWLEAHAQNNSAINAWSETCCNDCDQCEACTPDCAA